MKILVIGAGAAGLMVAANINAPVLVLERSEKAGKKIYITGKGRCNLTNIVAPADFLKSVISGDKFATSCIYRFPPSFVISFFEENGLRLKIERGKRVFPASDKASDVTKTLVNKILYSGSTIKYNTFVSDIKPSSDGYDITFSNGEKIFSNIVVVATGGKSYPYTGSDGSMYKVLAALGHTIIPQYPALVPFHLKEDVSSLKGISFYCVGCKVEYDGGENRAEGELLFTDKGVSGPVVLTLSALAAGKSNLSIYIDFFPYKSAQEIDKKLVNIFSQKSSSALKTALSTLLPKSLALYMISYASLDGDKKCGEVLKVERAEIVKLIKGLRFLVSATGGFEQAVITRGGVELTQIDPKTMESKLHKNLYIIGEVLNIDALTGGFNLQLAFSTALSAAKSINQKI